jgi:8-oxo-dGTP diphosphatase
VRELREETGLVGSSARVIAETLDGFPESRLVFRTRFVEMDAVAGQPSACEPAKTPSWNWYDWRSLPQPLFRPVASLVASGYEPYT